MLKQLAPTYPRGNVDQLEEYQIAEKRNKVASGSSHPNVAAAWSEYKANPSFSETMYWQRVIPSRT